tara:strand:- start:305 stop:544 length:240 start_codon:yes stop_codon:yes gene_type:complete
MWFNLNNMSGEQITNSSVETQNLEGDLHSLKNNPKKQRVDINVLLNKVRLAQKKEKMESTIFFSLIAAVILVTGIIVSI